MIAVIVYAVLRMLLSKSQLTGKQFSWIYLATLLGIGLLFLGFTGRLHPLFALLGAVLPFAMRLLARSVQAASLYRILRQTWQGMGAGMHHTSSAKGPASSEINSRYVHMVLVHETGKMDGTVLEGSYKGEHLSRMALEQLLALLRECQADPDSCNLLIAYLDREHEGWQTHYAGSESAYKNTAGDRDMSETQALDILGLPTDATPEDIVSAHRRLIQKIHPDRGGSTYLAAKINAAKELLVRLRGKAD